MNASATLANAAPPQGANAPLRGSVRLLAFPLLTNVWPLLLFVSQKVFVLPGLALAGFGDAAYRRDLWTALIISLFGLLVYFLQYANYYDQAHLIGFILFVWSMPLLNHATRQDPTRLRRLLTYLTLFNAVMGFYLLASNIDLYGLRGLNRVETTDGVTNRVYFESASLAAVVLLSSFSSRWLKLATLAIVTIFVVAVAKSVVVMALLGFNLIFPHLLRSPPHVKVIAASVALVTGVLLFIYLPVIRPDIDLSMRVKQFQLDIILGMMNNNWSGLGWGFFMPVLASDVEQPYQVEMQLPMLLLQLGPIALSAILLMTLALFMSAAERPMRGLTRFAIYAVIGFNNPWLFVPSWYLTCQLLLRDDDPPPEPVSVDGGKLRPA